MLTFEINQKQNAVEVHCDAEGLEVLRGILTAVERYKTHEHLMTPSWGGTELTEAKQGDTNTLVNQVTVHFWPKATSK